MAIIGIDFGTEFCSVAAKLQNGHVSVVGFRSGSIVWNSKWLIFQVDSLPDEQGKVRIASCVSFVEDEIRIGNIADLKREDNLKNTVYGQFLSNCVCTSVDGLPSHIFVGVTMHHNSGADFSTFPVLYHISYDQVWLNIDLITLHNAVGLGQVRLKTSP